MGICYVTIGDWSEDGHNQWSVFSYESNLSIAEQRAGWEKTEERSGLRLSNKGGGRGPSAICQEYQSNAITPFHIEMLRRYVNGDSFHVCDCGPGGMYPTEERLAKFALDFIAVSAPDFRYSNLQEVKGLRSSYHNEKCNIFDKWFKNAQGSILNGWWLPESGSKFNTGFGYGLYGSRSYGRSPPDGRTPTEPTAKLVCYTKDMGIAWNWRLIGDMPYELELPRLITHSLDSCVYWKSLKEISPHFVGQVVVLYNRVFFENYRDFIQAMEFFRDEAVVRISDRILRERY